MPCAKCGAEDADKKCGKCLVTFYCSRECQQQHWKVHKKECAKLASEHQKRKEGDGDAAAPTKAVAAAEEQVARSAVNEKPSTDPTSNASSATPSETPDEPAKPESSAPKSEGTNGNSGTKTAPEASVKPAATPQGLQGIPSKPFQCPANLSPLGQKLVTELKSVLEGPADQIADTLLQTSFCESAGENQRRVDIRVMFALHQLLTETLKANPESTVEVFKRMLAIKMMLKRPDNTSIASWASIVGQQCLVKAQELRLAAIKNSTPPKSDTEGTIQLPQEVLEEVRILQMDAVAFLHIGNRFFSAALLGGKPEILDGLTPASAKRLHDMLQVSLGFALRHMADPNKGRVALWQRVADTTVSEPADAHYRALATYALAHDACQNQDKANFDMYIQQTHALWGQLGNPTLPGFIERHISMGVCTECAGEMSGVMDGHEIRFKQFILAQVRHAEAGNMGGQEASSSGASSSAGTSSGKGARLIPGGSSSEIEPAASSKAEPQARMTQGAVAAARARIAALEVDMKKGYGLYEEGKMEAGVEHFAALLKKAYEMPLTGMSISLIYSLSHAHIEGAAQIRRWGKADLTIKKLKEFAEIAETTPIPNSIPTIADQLHLWWREKSANLYSRQRKFDKALETLEGAVPHAEKLSKKAVSAVMILLSSAHVEAFLSGSPRANMASLQEAVDKGIAALKADPPPVGGSTMEAGGGNRATPAQQWAAQTKLELWIKVLPMMRALEAEGLDIDKAEAVLLPLAEKFELTVGETVFNAEQFLNDTMASNKGLGGRLGKMNSTTMLFAFAVLLPVALMIWLAVYALTAPPEDLDDSPAEEIPTEL